ncbi:MAG: NAD(P)-dependent alcohol dehydrogenase [Pseudomonadota bacterium]
MKAVIYEKYGPVDVLQIEEVPTPEPAADEILIKVRATAVTTADWRMRSLEMPGAMKILGRLMFGILGPKNKVLGTDVAGDVVKVGSSTTTFKVGDAVFGHIGKGGHAEFAVAKEKSAILPKPEALTYEKAAALPFGALCALVFLRDFAKVKEGHHILIIGASGNVGVYAVQIAKALGARVTAVASTPNADLVERLGADEFVDYKTTDLAFLSQKFDVIFDTFGSLSFKETQKILTDEGLFLPLNFSLGEAFVNLLTGWTRKKKMMTGVNGDRREDLSELVGLIQCGKLKPVVDKAYELEDIRSAHQHVEGRNRKGSVVVQINGT